MPWWAWLLIAGAIGGLLYWQLVITEGAYLGPRVVTWLYNLGAGRYDYVKGFEPAYEAFFLGQPIARWLEGADRRLLDVATGTGRLPQAVLQATEGSLDLVALDRSWAMLCQASAKLESWEKVTLLQHDAEVLPFVDSAFAVVTCVEALEFMAKPKAVLAELWRVLQPGGLLVLTGRLGWQAALMPGKAFNRTEFTALLAALGAQDVRVQPWQVDYDLYWVVKPGLGSRSSLPDLPGLPGILQCPHCAGTVSTGIAGPERLACARCSWVLQCHEGIWRPASVVRQ